MHIVIGWFYFFALRRFPQKTLVDDRMLSSGNGAPYRGAISKF